MFAFLFVTVPEKKRARHLPPPSVADIILIKKPFIAFGLLPSAAGLLSLYESRVVGFYNLHEIR